MSDRQTLVDAAKTDLYCSALRRSANALTIEGVRQSNREYYQLADALREVETWVAERMADAALAAEAKQ